MSHLEYLYHHSVTAVDVDGFEHFAIFASSKLPDQLVIILVAERRWEKRYKKNENKPDPLYSQGPQSVNVRIYFINY